MVAAAADFLLDMLVHLQETSTMQTNWPQKDINDSMKDIKCASSVKFDTRFDDTTFIDFLLVKKVVLYAVQMLYGEQRYTIGSCNKLYTIFK